MDDLLEAGSRALSLLFTRDSGLWEVVYTSFFVSLQAVLYISLPALAVAFALAYSRFPGRRLLISIFHTLVAVPALVIGLVLYLLLSSSGPLGDLRLLFTQPAMILGQMLLAFPIVVAMAHAALAPTDRAAWETARTLGANRPQAMMTVMNEARTGLFVALVAAFGRVLAEVGCAMIVGGNILHQTRSLPTAILLEYSKGELIEGLALGIVLLVLALGLILGLNAVHNRFADN